MKKDAGSFYKTVSVIVFIVSVLGGIGIGSEIGDSKGFAVFCGIVFSAFILCCFLDGLGEIVEKLHEISQNTRDTSFNEKRQHLVKGEKQRKEDEGKIYKEENLYKNLEEKKVQTLNDFVQEIRKTETADLKLIVKEQRELYTPEEITYIEKEIQKRTNA